MVDRRRRSRPEVAETMVDGDTGGDGLGFTEDLLQAAAELQKIAEAGTDLVERFDLWDIVTDLSEALMLIREAVRAYAARPEIHLNATDQEVINQALTSIVQLVSGAEDSLHPEEWLVDPADDERSNRVECPATADADNSVTFEAESGWRPAQAAVNADAVSQTLIRLATTLRKTVAEGADVAGQGPLELAVADLVDAVAQIRGVELLSEEPPNHECRESAAEAVHGMVELAQLGTNRVDAASDRRSSAAPDPWQEGPDPADPRTYEAMWTRESARPGTSGSASAHEMVRAAAGLYKTAVAGSDVAGGRNHFELMLADLVDTLVLTRAGLRAYAARAKVGLDGPTRQAFMEPLDLWSTGPVPHWRHCQRRRRLATTCCRTQLATCWRARGSSRTSAPRTVTRDGPPGPGDASNELVECDCEGRPPQQGRVNYSTRLLLGKRTRVRGDRLLLTDVAHGRGGGCPLDRVDAGLGSGQGLVGLAGGDDLTVSSFEPEPVLALGVFVDLELRRHH